MAETDYKKSIVSKMKALGTYKKEFEKTIERLAALYAQLDLIDKQYIKSGGNPVIVHTNKAGASNPTKNPFLTARDEVYTQLLAHERELGLTPAALKKINESVLRTKQVSGFASALADALRGAGE